MKTLRLAILDDYQSVGGTFANWHRVEGLEVIAFRDHISGESVLTKGLENFDAILLMRERTPFPASLIEKLPNLKLLITTGMKNASINVEAARARGITVCGTRSNSVPPAELTWALVLALLRDIPARVAAARAGTWQTSVGLNAAGRQLGLLGLGKIGSIRVSYLSAREREVLAMIAK